MKGQEKPFQQRADQKEIFNRIFCEHKFRVYNTVYRMVGGEDAQDLTQEIFIKAYLNLKKFRGDARLETWIYSITVNVCRDYLRRKSKTPGTVPYQEGKVAPGQGNPVAEYLDRRLIQEETQEVLLQLSPPLQEVLILRELQGLSYREIAAVAGIPEGTVKSRLIRARRAFKESCEERGLLG